MSRLGTGHSVELEALGIAVESISVWWNAISKHSMGQAYGVGEIGTCMYRGISKALLSRCTSITVDEWNSMAF